MKTILLAISCLIVAALLLASCGSAVTEEEDQKVLNTLPGGNLAIEHYL